MVNPNTGKGVSVIKKKKKNQSLEIAEIRN